MADIPIEQHLIERLETLAREQQRGLNDLLAEMLDQYVPSRRKYWARSMAQMADGDASPVWDAFSPDLAARSREILDAEFADYLSSRSEKPDNDG